MKRSNGFSLIEVLVAVAMTGIAVAGLVGTLGYMSKSEARALEREKVQALAQDKIDEVMAVGTYDQTEGNFEDLGVSGYSWTMTLDTTQLPDVDSVTVTVTKDTDSTMSQSLGTLVYRPTTTGAAP
ncbi:MAG: type II secretion system protein [Armatimonadetes bacterium]|nr:type II secretion system protein [Armatimonadota bacterium]